MIPDKVLSVTELTRSIRKIVEDCLPVLWVEGEISNHKLNRSKHRYFTLKDSGAQIPCVMWRTRPVPEFDVDDGLRIKVNGRITVWEQGGRYQLDVYSMVLAGLGPLQAALEQLKRKLGSEGLFAAERKRSLPRFPRAIGIVTSPTGAAIHDLVWGFFTRFPPAKLYLIPVAVQGEGSSEEIARAVEAFNRIELVDLIIVGRGGGSFEDLWAFNEERLVRAVADSRLPVVSAVGHEVDVTLCDLAADVRSPTPTGAASLVVPDGQDLKSTLLQQDRNLRKILTRALSLRRERLSGIIRGYGFRRVPGRISEERFKLDNLARNIESAVYRKVTHKKQSLDSLLMRLRALSPNAVLNRGYSVTRRSDGSIVKNAADLIINERLDLSFKRGGASAVVLDVRNNGS